LATEWTTATCRVRERGPGGCGERASGFVPAHAEQYAADATTSTPKVENKIPIDHFHGGRSEDILHTPVAGIDGGVHLKARTPAARKVEPP
jgi:hypothetical protein